MMMDWIRALFCKHDWRFHRNIYGDEIILCGYKRSKWICNRCGKFQLREALQEKGGLG